MVPVFLKILRAVYEFAIILWVIIMNNKTIVKRSLSIRILMLVFTVALLVAMISIFMLSIREVPTNYKEGVAENILIGSRQYSEGKIKMIGLPGALLSVLFLLLSIASFSYFLSLSAWRIRVTDESIFLKTITTGEVEYKKSDIVVSNIRPIDNLPNNNNREPVLGSRYVIWVKTTKQQITDVYGRDKNSALIVEMCSNNK